MTIAKFISDLRRIADILESADGLVVRRHRICIEQDVRIPFLGAKKYFQSKAIPTTLIVDLEASWKDYSIKGDNR